MISDDNGNNNNNNSNNNNNNKHILLSDTSADLKKHEPGSLAVSVDSNTLKILWTCSIEQVSN